ncbi:Adaptive-response sensory-kinase SasA [Asticcacaulis sp. MM231]
MSRSSANSAYMPHANARSDAAYTDIGAAVCALASALFGLPLAFLKVFDGDALVTLAVHGFPDIDALDHFAFIERKLIPGVSLLVEDATHDSRFFLESAVLRSPNLRFYVDMPLVYEGRVMGVLGLCDPQAGLDFDDRKLVLLEQFAHVVATLIALAKGAEARDGMLDELQSQQSRMDSAADMTGLGYWKIDLESRAVTWSKGLYTLFGLSPETYTPDVASQLDIYRPEDSGLLIDSFQRAVNSGEDFDVEVRIVRATDKALRLMRVKGGVDYNSDGQAARLCAVVRDITPELPAQEAFLNEVTEDLRAPLKDIVSFARKLDSQGGTHPDIATYAHDLLVSAHALEGLLDAQSVDDEAVDVAEIIKELVDDFASTAQALHTRLSAHFVDFARTRARFDVMRVQQVLHHLLDNACRHTEGGVISVTASQVQAENPVTLMVDTHLHVSVRDTGTGMDEAHVKGLFKAGHKGMGLSIAQAIIDMLGGYIGVVSHLGEGTNVWFEIPMDWVEAPVTAPDVKAAPRMRTLTRQRVEDIAPAARPPAYAPTVAPKHPPVDEHYINREYLRALLADMKLEI